MIVFNTDREKHMYCILTMANLMMYWLTKKFTRKDIYLNYLVILLFTSFPQRYK